MTKELYESLVASFGEDAHEIIVMVMCGHSVDSAIQSILMKK